MTFKDLIDAARPYNIADAFRKLGLGTFLAGLSGATQTVETLTVTSHVATLTYPAQFVQGVTATAGTKTGAAIVGGKDATATAQGVGIPAIVKYDHTAGTITFHADDAVTECKVQYLTHATVDAMIDAESGIE